MLHAVWPRLCVKPCFILGHLSQPCFILGHLSQPGTPRGSYSIPPLQTDALDSFDILLRQSSTVQQCKQLHAQIILFGLPNSSFLSARLISAYSRFNLLSDARSIFSSFPIKENRNLLLWNSILRANLSHGSSSDAFNLYVKMRELGVGPDGFSLPLIIRACASIGDPRLCSAVHHHIVLMGFQFHLHVGNELIGMYGKIGCVDCARKVFDRMPSRSVVSWNTLISCYALNYDCDAAFGVFERMELEGLEPNPVTWTSLLSAHARCGRQDEVVGLFRKMRMKGNGSTAESVAVVVTVCADLDALEKGKEIHGFIFRSGFEDYIFVRNSLICMYGKHGLQDDAWMLFSEMKTKSLVSWNALISSYAAGGLCDEALEVFLQLELGGEDSNVRPNVVSWSAVIGGFASNGQGDKSLELFRQMQCVGVEPNAVTIASVLSVCAALGALAPGREVHCHVIRGRLDANILAGNGLLHMYAKCGSLRDGRLVFDRMEARDLISWNSMIAGYGMHGFGMDALSAFSEMVKTSVKPDGITFVALLSACSHAGLVAEGRQLFGQMINEFMLVPRMEHYACMVDLLGRAGLLREASEFVEKIPMTPNACVWGALLNSCRIYRNATVAEETASRHLGIGSETMGSYMLLSNIYAACGRWEDSARVRMLTKTRGLKKSPGQSWIEVKKRIYMFAAGNALQMGLEGVYSVLEDLGLKMEADGYIPDKSFVLQDVSNDEKKQILYGHSEKLAIAFGYANVPPNMPIRVMKNLRVCGDCHNWTKFFSKMTGRNVIVRDGYRFHHFMDGSCSCNDYW